MYELLIKSCPAKEAERVIAHLEALDVLSITWSDEANQAIIEPSLDAMPLWPVLHIQAFFNLRKEALMAKKILSERFGNLKYQIEKFVDVSWDQVQKDSFQPQFFGHRLWICPSWHEPPDPTAVNLILNPGLAFGTGTHPTTAMCLRWLDSHALSQKTIIDYGCGSGILALAALKLGARHADAMDLDPQALVATENNALLNQIEDGQLSIFQDASPLKPADLLMANILLNPLLSLKTQFHRLIHDQGRLVLSGLLRSQAKKLIQAYQDQFKIVSAAIEKEWILLEFKPICSD